MGSGVIGAPPTSRLIGKPGAVSQVSAAVISVSPGSTGSFGSWVEAIASTASEIVALSVTCWENSSLTDPAVFGAQIGVGAAASETAVATHWTAYTPYAGEANVEVRFAIPPRIAAGARVSVALSRRDSGGTFSVILNYANLANIEGGT